MTGDYLYGIDFDRTNSALAIYEESSGEIVQV
jgi:hypothetical protein